MSKNEVKLKVLCETKPNEKELEFISDYLVDEFYKLLDVSLAVLGCNGNWTLSGNILLEKKEDK